VAIPTSNGNHMRDGSREPFLRFRSRESSEGSESAEGLLGNRSTTSLELRESWTRVDCRPPGVRLRNTVCGQAVHSRSRRAIPPRSTGRPRGSWTTFSGTRKARSPRGRRGVSVK
jgi:hypothetical protein